MFCSVAGALFEDELFDGSGQLSTTALEKNETLFLFPPGDLKRGNRFLSIFKKIVSRPFFKIVYLYLYVWLCGWFSPSEKKITKMPFVFASLRHFFVFFG